MKLYVSVYYSFPMKVCILYNCTAYIRYKSFRIITKIPFSMFIFTIHLHIVYLFRARTVARNFQKMGVCVGGGGRYNQAYPTLIAIIQTERQL